MDRSKLRFFYLALIDTIVVLFDNVYMGNSDVRTFVTVVGGTSYEVLYFVHARSKAGVLDKYDGSFQSGRTKSACCHKCSHTVTNIILKHGRTK